MRQTWTYRPGDIDKKDRLAMRGLRTVHPAAARILLTGEASMDAIGELACDALLTANELVAEPLFVITAWDTVAMTRFNAVQVWPELGVELLKELCAQEAKRFEVEPFEPSQFDFFESMFDFLELKDSYTTTQDHEGLYLNALTLFGKPLYLDTPASTFFSAYPSILQGRATMTESMRLARDRAKDPTAQRLTNRELDFLVNIC